MTLLVTKAVIFLVITSLIFSLEFCRPRLLMRQNQFKSITRNHRSPLLSVFTILLTLLVGFTTPLYASSDSCLRSLTNADSLKHRRQLVRTNPGFRNGELLGALEEGGRLVYKGNHPYVPGTEFLASNEFDWSLTPFDHRKADVLVAFGTNSAWEIAADKKIDSLIIADWSPNPLIAQAYILEPLWKLARSPVELILLLGGLIPSPETRTLSLSEAFTLARAAFRDQSFQRLNQLSRFMDYLANEPTVTDLQLQVLNSYFNSTSTLSPSAKSLGPFTDMTSHRAHSILDLLEFRYDDVNARRYNPKTQKTQEVFEQQSVFHNLKMFQTIKRLYSNNAVTYALTPVDDPQFYKLIAQKYAPNENRFSLSLSNIFECGGYNGLNFSGLQRLLTDTQRVFGATPENPLTVFRTTNDQPPHGFYRYDIGDETTVPRKDERDSKASPPSSTIGNAPWAVGY